MPQCSKPIIDSETGCAARAFLKHLEGRYRVRDAILFGSRARHSHMPESDADIAIVLEAFSGSRTAAVKEMAGISFHVMMETGIMVQALPLLPSELENPQTFSNPALIDNILRDGIRL